MGFNLAFKGLKRCEARGECRRVRRNRPSGHVLQMLCVCHPPGWMNSVTAYHRYLIDFAKENGVPTRFHDTVA